MIIQLCLTENWTDQTNWTIRVFTARRLELIECKMWALNCKSLTLSKWSSFTPSEWIDSTAKPDQSFVIVGLNCALISFNQLEDRSDSTDVTVIVQKCNLQKSTELIKALIVSYLETKLQSSTCLEVSSPNTGIYLSAVLLSIIRFITFQFADIWCVYCDGTGFDRVGRQRFRQSGRAVISRWIILLPDNAQDGPIIW